MPHAFVSATEVKRNFSRILRDVESGCRITITRNGTPVAVLASAGSPGSGGGKAHRRMVALMREGLSLGFSGPMDRDEAHER